ncbi:MAG: hypothetical protein EBY36_02315, partial [Gammaproteobacteria bacterium]|nr:hypothetical protein [Gammaproteobacteria bacterium]
MKSNDPKGNSATVDWRPDPGLVAGLSLPPRIDVSPADVDTFQRDGVILLKNLFPDWVEPLRAGLQRNMDEAQNYAFPCDSV